MVHELMASGGILDAGELAGYEAYLGEGDKCLLELDLRWSVTQDMVSELERRLRQAGVENVRVETASPMLRVYFNKGFPWLAVIAAAILGLIVLAVLIVGWRLFKEVVPEGLQPLVGGFGLVLIFGLGIVILSRRLSHA